MVDYDPVFAILLGGAFAALYWAADAVVTIAGAVGRDVLVGVGAFMVVSWSLSAGYVSARTLRDRDDPLRGTAEHVLVWVVLFGGVAVLTTWSLGALLSFVLEDALETTFWFGMLFVTTVLTGALSIGAAGAYATVVDSTRH